MLNTNDKKKGKRKKRKGKEKKKGKRIHLYSPATFIGAIDGIVDDNVNTGNRDEAGDGDDNNMVVAMFLDEWRWW